MQLSQALNECVAGTKIGHKEFGNYYLFFKEGKFKVFNTDSQKEEDLINLLNGLSDNNYYIIDENKTKEDKPISKDISSKLEKIIELLNKLIEEA